MGVRLDGGGAATRWRGAATGSFSASPRDQPAVVERRRRRHGGRNAGTSFSASPRDQFGGRGGGGGGDAFGGYGSGRQAQMDSSRGAASRSSMSGGGARPMPAGVQARRCAEAAVAAAWRRWWWSWRRWPWSLGDGYEWIAHANTTR